LAILGVAAAGLLPAYGEDYYAHPKYTFNYGVQVKKNIYFV
jgi:hypothetical protein